MYKVDIPNHCPESWNGMKDCGEHKDCQACKRMVYDFTKKTDLEIYQFLKAHKKERVCGRFTSGQLNRPLNITPSIFSRSMKFLLPTIFVFGINDAMAHTPDYEKEGILVVQSITDDSVKISGRIVDSENYDTVIGSIFIKGTKEGVVTDENGEFEWVVSRDLLSSGDTLVCKAIGYDTQEFELDPATYSNLIIKMTPQVFIGEIIIKKEPLIKRMFRRKAKEDDKA